MLRRRVATAVVFAAAVVALPGVAQAKWSATATGAATIGAEIMQNATGFTAVCTTNTANSTIDLAWTATTDPAVNVYHVIRTGSAGGTSSAFDVAGRATFSFRDTPPTPNGAVYSYTIAAGNKATFATSNWTTSALAAPLSRSFTGNPGGNKCV